MKKISNKMALIFVCIVIFLALTVVYCHNRFGDNVQFVYIYENGELRKVIDLKKVDDTLHINLGSNIICVEKDCVYMEYADCPDGLCVKQGKISKGGQSIVCLPNKTVVETKGKGGKVDAVAGKR